LAEDLFHPDIGIVVGYKITVVPLTIAAVAASLIPLTRLHTSSTSHHQESSLRAPYAAPWLVAWAHRGMLAVARKRLH